MNMDIDCWETARAAINQLYDASICCCHYTTPEAVLSIFSEYIKSKDKGHTLVNKCSMRASHIRFLNDLKEYQEGINWLKEKNYSAENLSENMYCISFCGDANLLSQWKWYGKNSGVAIVFRTENIKFKYWDAESIEGTALLEEDIKTRPLPVCYEDAKRQDFYTRMGQSNSSGVDISRAMQNSLFIPFCKNKGFCEEKESRLIFYVPDNYQEYGITKFNINYYHNNGIIKPTLNVEFRQRDRNINIIDKLIVGPGQNQDLVFNALIHMFDNGPYKFINGNEHSCKNGVCIKKSDIPFRG